MKAKGNEIDFSVVGTPGMVYTEKNGRGIHL
jgi:hypothetical protein